MSELKKKRKIYIVKTVFFFVSLNLFCSCIMEGGKGLYVGESDHCGFALNRYNGKGLRWNRNDFPIDFYIHTSVPDEAAEIFIASLDHWNMSWEEYLLEEGVEPFTLFDIPDKNNKYSGKPGNDSYNMIFFIEENFARYQKEEIQAITSVSTGGWHGKIKDTDIIINAEHFSFFYDETYIEDIRVAKNSKTSFDRRIASSMSEGSWHHFKRKLISWLNFFIAPFKKKKPLRQIARIRSRVPSNQVDFASLSIHESGHSPGRGHKEDFSMDNNFASRSGNSVAQKSVVSVMKKVLLKGESRRRIGEHDLESLFCAYPPEAG